MLTEKEFCYYAEKYIDTVYRVAFSMLKNPHDADDMTQDTFMKLQRYKHHFDPSKGKLKSYLFQIAYRLMLEKLNRRTKWRKLLPFLTAAPKQELAHADRITIREAIAKLPEIQRAVILLFYYHDMTQEEIAEVRKIPRGTVKARLHTAVQKLKKEWEADEHESRSL